MPKKKVDLTPEIVTDKTLPKKETKPSAREEIIEVSSDDDELIEGLATHEALVPKISESLPVLRQSTSLKVQDPLTVYLKEIARHKLLTPEEEKEGAH